ncbi:MAG TPA: glycogen debranching N-terminal domain-containing protein [Gemmatimonadaceae bacterium]|nr:glycogen debranching N-terminal domain-containing protein [Gemmatimonadaceae bacterium]
MPTSGSAAHTAPAETPEDQHTAHQDDDARKHRLLSHASASITSSIAQATVIKNKGVFFLSQPGGDVPLGQEHHGFGLYYHGCRFLDGYQLLLSGTTLNALASTAARDYMATLELTNPDVHLENGPLLPKESIGVQWERMIQGDALTLHERIEFENYGLEHVEFPVSFTFHSCFDDIFTVRGMADAQRGRLHPPSWTQGRLTLAYDGLDHRTRSLTVHFSPAPQRTDDSTAYFDIVLDSKQHMAIEVSVVIAESTPGDAPRHRPHATPSKPTAAALEQSTHHWMAAHTQVHTESVPLRRLIDRSLRDLDMLRTTLNDQEFFAAGVPWFVTLFGRDSLITALQTLAFDPDIAAHTLRLLARYQGKTTNAWRDEQPGKILHELRVDELTRLGDLPYSPYYGTVDATPLFLIVLGRYAQWTGDLSLFTALRPHVDLALEWVAHDGDTDQDGYVDYQSASSKGLVNQGWKDSGDAIVNEDGSIATPPIALAEVQGYVYLAKRLMAELFRRIGDANRARALEQEAGTLRSRFNRDFWLPDRNFFAMALQQDHRPVAVIASNAGQALWTGIVEDDKARATMERLMADDMFSGWGIRTLSCNEVRYNPIGYHLGTVWPHDNAIIATGFHQHRFDDAAGRIANGIIGAAMHFRHMRLPELFAGYPRSSFGMPVHYPVACHPQAWAAGSTPLLVAALLGLEPEAFEHRLRIVRPMLPHSVEWIELHHLRVGQARAAIRFQRSGKGVSVQVLDVQGELEIEVEQAHAGHHAVA